MQVFLRYYHADELNSSLQRSVKLIVTCQAYVRGLVIRHRYQNWVQQQRDATQRMCEALQQLVIGVSSQHADIQRRLCQEDIKAKVCYLLRTVVCSSGIFRISVRRGRGAVAVKGVGSGGGGWVSSPEKKSFFVPKMISLGSF